MTAPDATGTVHAQTEPSGSTPRRSHVPGQPDMWVFVLVESLLFTSYFSVYLLSRAQHEEAYLGAQADLDLWLGIVDTLVLLTSSWSIARCVQAARAGRYRAAVRGALLTGGLGAVFLILKVAEWVRQIGLGNTFVSSDFFQHFFFLTGLHLLHLVIGYIVLGVLLHHLSGPDRRSQQIVETCATYWHSVDFYWVLIFALLYVVR